MRRGTKRDRLLALKNEYIALGHEPPIKLNDVAQWALREGKWEEAPADATRRLARELGSAMAQESYTDPQGRSVRINHAAPVRGDGGQLEWTWDDIRRPNIRAHMQAAVQSRRMAIVHDAKQLKTDVDSFNENNNPGQPIQLSLDVTNDVAEIEALEKLTRELAQSTVAEQNA